MENTMGERIKAAQKKKIQYELTMRENIAQTEI